MKRTIILVLLMVVAVAAQAQHTKITPQTSIMLKKIANRKAANENIHTFVTLKEGTDPSALAQYGVKVNTTVGNQMTVDLPANRLADLVASGLCTTIDVGKQMRPLTDRVRADMGVDYIHQGINLPQGYDGSGVVVGIIDVGFEYGHPSFYDTTGTTLRIKRVWQQGDNLGTHPAGFTYGSELTTQEQILAAVTDMSEQGHGSHVLGIAAGCGAPDGNGRRYRGIAPGADIVLVGTTLRGTDILDGIHYIHNYARSVSKPCVINLSLGTQITSHDSTGEFEAILENYLRATQTDSIVVVVAAGNSGGSKSHLYHHFDIHNRLARTICLPGIAQDFNIIADIWGNEGEEFSLSITLHDRSSSNNRVSDITTPTFSTAVDSTYTFQITSHADSVFDCIVAVTPAHPSNNRPEILVSITKPGFPTTNDLFSLSIESDSADIHMWGDNIDFVSHDNTGFFDGDDEYTIAGIGANSDAVISVGSYATRTVSVSESGAVSVLSDIEEGNLSYFSSHGPTVDGKVKPDICTPGEVIVSVFSNPYMPYYPSMYLFDSTSFGGQTYHYCLMQGTSMAAPVMTGTIALWMQHNPSINVDSARAIIHATGRSDRFTGEIPATGSNEWGWGKLNAFGGLGATIAPMHYLEVTTENCKKGFTNGRGYHPEGPVTIEAIAADGFNFSEWSDGVTENPRTIELTSDTFLVASFVQSDCDTITQFPWNVEISDNMFNCWDTIVFVKNSDWMTFAATLISMGNYETGGINNWLVSPYIIPESGTAIFYTGKSLSGDSLAILVITEAGDTVTLSDIQLESTPNVENHTSLTQYAGQLIRVALRHHSNSASGMATFTSIRFDYLQGIENAIDSKIKTSISGLDLKVENPNGQMVQVYDIMGRCLTTSNQSVFQIHLPAPGVYLVKPEDGLSKKIMAIR